jgi:hypothetical protein
VLDLRWVPAALTRPAPRNTLNAQLGRWEKWRK